MPAAWFDLLSSADARQRFGGDVAAAGLVAVRLVVANRTERPYVLAVPLIGMVQHGGVWVRPLPWSGARARIAVSPSANGWKPSEEIERELVVDRVLQPGESLTGIIFYPAGDYVGVDLLLIDQLSARSERLQAPLPPPPPR